jgi:hypothetical protein
MQQGLGWLRWSVADFWEATLDELLAGIVGFAETRGAGSSDDKPLPNEQYDQLIAMVEKEMAAAAEQIAQGGASEGGGKKGQRRDRYSGTV